MERNCSPGCPWQRFRNIACATGIRLSMLYLARGERRMDDEERNMNDVRDVLDAMSTGFSVGQYVHIESPVWWLGKIVDIVYSDGIVMCKVVCSSQIPPSYTKDYPPDQLREHRDGDGLDGLAMTPEQLESVLAKDPCYQWGHIV